MSATVLPVRSYPAKAVLAAMPLQVRIASVHDNGDSPSKVIAAERGSSRCTGERNPLSHGRLFSALSVRDNTETER